MKTYLITGGAGFIGSHFIKYLFHNKSDIHVINLDSLAYCGNLANLREVENMPDYQFIHGDIGNSDLVSDIFQKHNIDYVVHFAAMTHVDRCIISAEPFVSVNVSGTLNLLEETRKAWHNISNQNKKFLYISTDEVYGELCEEGYFTEHTLLAPRNPYSASKAAGEMLVRAYGMTHGLPVNITRCSNNYGPNQFPEKLIPLLIHNCLHHMELPIYGDGLHIRDWLYVEDHCSAIDAVLTYGHTGEIFNIGGHNEKTTLDIACAIIDYIHDNHDLCVTKDLIRHVPDRKGHDRRYAIDPDKIYTRLHWCPSVSFDEGIRRTIKWYLENPEWLSDITSGEYQTYYQQQYGI